jgi:hypothetical protein
MPTTFEDAGLATDRLEEMADKAVESGPIGGFIKLERDAVLHILKIAAELK